MLKKILLIQLQKKVKKYFAKHKPLLVVVAGSVGKTSTRFAIATVLAEKFRVRTDEENHNTIESVPVSLLGIKYPENPHSISEWREVLKAMNLRIKGPKDVDVIVQELGTDRPGEISYFAKYLQPDIAVVTAISEEHMENFPSLDAVAREELAIANYSKLLLVNDDDVDTKYANYATTTNIDTYGLNEHSEYRLIVQPADPLDGRIGILKTPEWGDLSIGVQVVGDAALKTVAAAACVGAKLGLSAEQVAVGASKVRAPKGRMNVLRGMKGSTIIDDTYNSSPLAVKAALETLYATETTQRIAVLGSMNELGSQTQVLHAQVGGLCDPLKLEWVVTIGDEAAKYLAPAAEKHGCQVRTFHSPVQAGGFVHSVLRPGAVVLVKGSQNGVFAEEAVKELLHATEEEEQLVRQSDYWKGVKQAQLDAFQNAPASLDEE